MADKFGIPKAEAFREAVKDDTLARELSKFKEKLEEAIACKSNKIFLLPGQLSGVTINYLKELGYKIRTVEHTEYDRDDSYKVKMVEIT